MTKIITSELNEESKSTFKNRFDILFEHHKYLKKKKSLLHEGFQQAVISSTLITLLNFVSRI